MQVARSRDAAPLSAVRIPLSALTPMLDDGSAVTTWTVDPDGMRGRALVIPANATYTVALALDRPVVLIARVLLLPHDWLNGREVVRGSVAVIAHDGGARVLWRRPLYPADRGRPRGYAVEVTMPADTVSLQLTIETTQPPREGSVARAIWLQPVLEDLGSRAPDRAQRDGVDPDGAQADGAQRGVAGAAPVRSGPVISVLIPVHDPPPQMLEEAIGSVVRQTFAGWELCLVDDGSRSQPIKAILERHARRDGRIKLVTHEHAQGIAAATNAAMDIASGRYVALLDHDDTLTPDALQRIADRIDAEPELDMVYSDEDIVLDGKRVWAHLKPAWSPDTMRTNGYTCHLGVYRRGLVQEIGGFRDEFNGSQDVDMILRLMERTDRIAHVPEILYHWRAHPDSTAGGDAKPYAYVAARRAIAAHVERTGLDADVGYGPPGLYRLAHRVDPGLTVEIALACEDPDTLRAAAHTWNTQPHPSWRAVIATNNHTQITDALHAAGIPDQRITLIDADPDPTTALHQAAQHATATHLLLMQAPAIGLTHDWLTRLLGYSNQDGIAAAGPVILAPDGRIQQAGIALPEGIPLHLNYGQPAAAAQPVVYNLSAVSGVLATSRTSYERLGGLRPEYRELALIDYCVRAGACGNDGRTVLVPDARLRIEADRPINDLSVIWRLRDGWRQTHTHDPYYNRAYRTDRGDFIAR